MKGVLTAVGGILTLGVLLVVGTQLGLGLVGGLAAIGVAAFVAMLIALGPDRLGLTFLVVGLFLAPMNGVKPFSGGNVSFSDLSLVVAIALLLPRMMKRGTHLPPLFLIGAAVMTVGGLLSCIFSVAPPVLSLGAFLRFALAAILLPMIMSSIRPNPGTVTLMAWAYVAGQIVSVGKATIEGAGPLGRSAGYTTHPNFFGLGGQIAFALLIFLFYRVPKHRRWIVVAATGIVVHGVLISGSRASLICVVLVTVLWPFVERSAVAWYVLVSATAVLVVAAGSIFANAGEGSALGRLRGDSLQATYSDQARKQLLDAGTSMFWDHPVRGNGFAGVVELHNAYLEVAVGGGVLTLFGFLLLMASFVRPLFDTARPNRLAYVAVSYAAFGMLGPTLYDRIVWAPLAMVMIPVLGARGDSVSQTAESAAASNEGQPAVGAVSHRSAATPRPVTG